MGNIPTIDKNFILPDRSVCQDYLIYSDISQEPFEVCGLPWFKSDGQFARIPENIASSFSDNLKLLMLHTAGGMLRFKTDSRIISFEAKLLNTRDMSHMPRSGSSGFDFYIGSGSRKKFMKIAMPGPGMDYCSCIIENLDGKIHEWTVNFPLYNGIRSIQLGIEKGAELEPPTPFFCQHPLVFYGSSITQGGCASRPGNAYTNILSRWLNTGIVNLGFSGNAKGEPEMAELISTVNMSIFVMDYDHNAPDEKWLSDTHEPFFKIIRARNPDLPVVFITRPNFDEDVKMNKRRREVVYETYKNAIELGDKNVFFIDGQKLFGKKDRDACTVDCCHPNDLGFMRMAKYIYPVLKNVLEQSHNKKAEDI